MVKKSTRKEAIDSDLAAFQDFKKQWEDGTLTEDHLVVAATTKWAQTVAHKFKCPGRANDLRQTALMKLAKRNYKGEVPLDMYIVRILLKINNDELRKSGGKKREEFPPEMVDKKSQELFEKVLQRIASDKLMNELLAKRPELQRTIALIVLRAEEKVGRRRLAQLASQLLGRKVTRYEVESALRQLREAMSGHQEVSAKAASNILGRKVTQFELKIAITQLQEVVYSYQEEASDTYSKPILLNTETGKRRKSRVKRHGELLEGRIDIEEYLRVAAQIRQELGGRMHSNSTELVAEDRQQ